LSQLRHEGALNALQERTPSQLPEEEENEHTVWLILQRGP